MQEHPITGLASPSQARHVIHVEDLRVEDVARQRGDPSTVRRHHAPALACQELYFVLPRVHPVEADAGDDRAIGDRNIIGAAGSEKVKLVVADEMPSLPVAVDAEAEPRVGDAKAGFVEFGLNIIVEGNASEIASDHRLGIYVSGHKGCVHKPDGDYANVAKAQVGRHIGGVEGASHGLVDAAGGCAATTLTGTTAGGTAAEGGMIGVVLATCPKVLVGSEKFWLSGVAAEVPAGAAAAGAGLLMRSSSFF